MIFLAFGVFSDGEKINWYDLSLIFLSYFSHSKREYSGLYDRWEGGKEPKRWDLCQLNMVISLSNRTKLFFYRHLVFLFCRFMSTSVSCCFPCRCLWRKKLWCAWQLIARHRRQCHKLRFRGAIFRFSVCWTQPVPPCCIPDNVFWKSLCQCL